MTVGISAVLKDDENACFQCESRRWSPFKTLTTGKVDKSRAEAKSELQFRAQKKDDLVVDRLPRRYHDAQGGRGRISPSLAFLNPGRRCLLDLQTTHNMRPMRDPRRLDTNSFTKAHLPVCPRGQYELCSRTCSPAFDMGVLLLRI